MLRIMNLVTFAIVAICFLIGAGIALADDAAVTGEKSISGKDAVIDASRPTMDKFEQNLAAADGEDVYEFDDYDADVKQTSPRVEPTEIREC